MDKKKFGVARDVSFDQFDESTLNEKQRVCYDLLTKWCTMAFQARKNNESSDPKQLLLILQGKSE